MSNKFVIVNSTIRNNLDFLNRIGYMLGTAFVPIKIYDNCFVCTSVHPLSDDDWEMVKEFYIIVDDYLPIFESVVNKERA